VRRTLFVSDLHLSAERPEEVGLFARFLREQVPGAEALYILGDLFEYWVGDDALAEDALGREVCTGLRTATGNGTPVHLMHGNRDFLIGKAFAEVSSATLLDDPATIHVAGEATLLMHGDTLCTDDVQYQAWRLTARSAGWQAGFLSQTLLLRHQAMRELREQSAQAIKAKPAEIMDVNAGAVTSAFRTHGVRRMIHGHTHRPARHEHLVDGNPCERWVLPDWYAGGGFLVADEAGLRLQRL